MLCALAFEFENVRLVVAEGVKQLCHSDPSLSSHQQRRVFRRSLHRKATCFSVITGWFIFFSKADAPMTMLFLTKAKRYGLMPAANCCRRCPSARASASNWPQSSGGWPLSSILRNTR